MSQAKAQLSAAAMPAHHCVWPTTRPTIMIAEDSPDGLEMMSTLLSLKGYRVLVAETGPRAIEVAQANIPDMILMDLSLPRLSGLDVARNLRQHPKLRQIPIIIVSGLDPAQNRRAALEAGCNDYLLKPIDFDELDAILDSSVPINS